MTMTAAVADADAVRRRLSAYSQRYTCASVVWSTNVCCTHTRRTSPLAVNGTHAQGCMIDQHLLHTHTLYVATMADAVHHHLSTYSQWYTCAGVCGCTWYGMVD
jgi:hypothetical protein